MRDCHTTDERLFAFVDGIEPDLETHVADCDECQEFLAELWIGELQTDLTKPVLRQIRFDEFLREIGQLAADVIGALGKALVEYGPGADLDTDDDAHKSDEE
ncbi:MAG: hypothetical protein QNJ75_05855 [Acidimicrobiia bacterium]|nr:hypothetical protein [Acidimicrobiia bacterium]